VALQCCVSLEGERSEGCCLLPVRLCTPMEGVGLGGEGCNIRVACRFSDYEFIFSLLVFKLGYQ